MIIYFLYNQVNEIDKNIRSFRADFLFQRKNTHLNTWYGLFFMKCNKCSHLSKNCRWALSADAFINRPTGHRAIIVSDERSNPNLS